MAARLSKVNRPLSQVEELAKKAMQKKKIAEANMAKNPPPRKACICAPTNHAGSFRCHLHRTTQKPLWAVQDNKSSMLDDGKPGLSRFGRAVSARSPHKSQALAVE
ncbi:uncharacterized protein LOC120007528 [Tripterygium wilfordii]|uniref:uncharacterized protein LOC120007528 n=1 Tax=Tripterygium wilfordii TaxID=458696 RepID=UPI0018F815EB|nr:uncharacterized protein LOC120007528 [Tripterygium wilfordii]